MDWKNTWEYNIEKKGKECSPFFLDSSLNSWIMEDCALLKQYPEVEEKCEKVYTQYDISYRG